MAEFAIVSAIVQIVDVGVRLGVKLYTFGETIADAGTIVISISKDVSLTSSVLKELAQNLERDKEGRVSSADAIQTVEEIVQECSKIFQEIDSLLAKQMKSLSPGGSANPRRTAVIRKIKWSFMQPKVQLLRSNLDKLKATLLLMLNVLTYARQLSERAQPDSHPDHQRGLIVDLARSRDEYTRKFDNLTRAKEAKPSSREDDAITEPFHIPQLGVFPESIHALDEQKEKDHTTSDLSIYSKLINQLLEDILRVHALLEPMLWTRIYDDIRFLHCREIGRFAASHGRDQVRTTMTGFARDCIAWDTVHDTQIGLNIEALSDGNPQRTKPRKVHNRTSVNRVSLKAVPPEYTLPYDQDHNDRGQCDSSMVPYRTHSHAGSTRSVDCLNQNPGWESGQQHAYQLRQPSRKDSYTVQNALIPEQDWGAYNPDVITNTAGQSLPVEYQDSMCERQESCESSSQTNDNFAPPPPSASSPTTSESLQSHPGANPEISTRTGLGSEAISESSTLPNQSQYYKEKTHQVGCYSAAYYQALEEQATVVDFLLQTWTLVPVEKSWGRKSVFGEL